MTPLRDVDLGHEGISGYYVKFIGLLGRGIGDVVVIAVAWLTLRRLSPTIDYKITDALSAIMLIKLALLLWSVMTLWTLVRSFLNGARWLVLESRGMQWAAQGEDMLRVTFYRGSDQIIRCDEATKTRRLAEDRTGRQYRKYALLRDGVLLAVLVAGYFYLPLAFGYAHDWLSPSLKGEFDRWDVAQLVRLVFLLFVIVPRTVDLLMVLLESAIHAAGAQFMPGANAPGP